MGGTSVNIVSMGGLSATGTAIGVPVQVNFHTWGNGTAVVVNSNLSATQVIPNGGTVEFFADPTPLDLMNPGATGRNPLATFTLPVQPEPIMPGGATRIPLPPAPPGAQYLMLTLNLMDAQGNPATMDFLQLPLDAALRPSLMSGRGLLAFVQDCAPLSECHWREYPSDDPTPGLHLSCCQQTHYPASQEVGRSDVG